MCAVDSTAAAGRNDCARRSSSSSAPLCACGRCFHLGYNLFLIQSAAFTQQESQNCKAATRERRCILSIVGLNDSVVPISGHSGRCGYSVAHLAEALKRSQTTQIHLLLFVSFQRCGRSNKMSLQQEAVNGGLNRLG